MSKIGKKPIAIPAGVTVTVDKSLVSVKWPKWSLSYSFLDGVNVVVEGSEVIVTINSDDKKNLWGLTRTLIQNMVTGTSEGYAKKLLVLWVGFTAKVAGSNLALALGFSHPIQFPIPQGITIVIEKDPKGNDIINLTWIDKQLLGETAAKIRKLKEPEPYKGKGIRYSDEVIKLKAGKAAKK